MTFANVTTLEEGVGAAGRRNVVTLMISGTTLQTNVIMSGEVLTYTSSLYTASTVTGVIHVRQLIGNTVDDRRVDILRRLNTPDYNIIGITENNTAPQIQAGTKTVIIEDAAMLRMPIREIVRRFNSVFGTANTVIAPGIATFKNFANDPLSTSSAFIALPDEAHIVLTGNLVGSQLSLLGALPSLHQSDQPWQPAIKMTSTGWTVFGILWAVFALGFLVSVAVSYWWFISLYL